MSAVETQHKTRVMPVALRPLEQRDVAQSSEIERDAFLNSLPSTPFRRELKNRRARYLVAWLRDLVMEGEAGATGVPDLPTVVIHRPLIGKLLHGARSLWWRASAWEPGQQFLTGFVGTWHIVDEAHIVSVGVRREYRGQGIGELLLIGAIEQAVASHARVLTLEVRASNHIARSLYRKYGFRECGVRKGYYTDNLEDAVIMTTDSSRDASFIEQFHQLVRVHESRWGRAERVLC